MTFARRAARWRPRFVRAFAALLLTVAAPAGAQGELRDGAYGASDARELPAGVLEVVAPRVRVIAGRPEFLGHAQRAAHAAERALDVLAPLFEFGEARPLPEIVLTIDGRTDVFNAFAPPLPRPRVVLRALFPTETPLAFRAQDDLYLLLVHELTHNLQLSYVRTPTGDGVIPRVGLVGETVARPPPMWFLEGIAVWAESEFTTGGRRNDALTTGLLHAQALEGDWPSLADAGLVTFGGWPAGNAWYLHGAGFTGWLIDRHGFGAVLGALRHFNAGLPFGSFSDAWREAAGVALEDEWDAWSASVRSEAEAGAAERMEGRAWTESGWFTRAPAPSPDGRRVAWSAWPPAVVVADVREGDEGPLPGDPRVLLRDRSPARLGWFDGDTLVYTRIHREAGREYGEVFLLDVRSGVERRITSGARARLPAVAATGAPGGCVHYVRDVVPEGSSVWRVCVGADDVRAPERLWVAPEGTHVVGLALSPGGRIAMSLWRAGFTDLALLDGERLVFLTSDAFQDLEPAWRDDGTLVFRSDRAGGAFDLFEITLPGGSDGEDVGSWGDPLEARRLTRSLGGAFAPQPLGDGLVFVRLGGDGYDLAYVDGEPLEYVRVERGRVEDVRVEQEGSGQEASGQEESGLEPPAGRAAEASFPVRPYSPLRSLVPYGWLPVALELAPGRVALGASVFGQDDSGRHAYTVTFGFDSSLAGVLGGGYAFVRYDRDRDPLLRAFEGAQPLSFGVQAGVWPHAPHRGALLETAAGAGADIALSLPLNPGALRAAGSASLVHLPSHGGVQFDARAAVTVSDVRSDDWGYRTRGPSFGVTVVRSAAPAGPSVGAWLDARHAASLAPLGVAAVADAAVRAGYRIEPGVPVGLGEGWAAVGSIGVRSSVRVGWRLSDGVHALERVTFEPRVRAWLGESLGLGFDVTVSADAVVNYGGAVSFGVTAGWADGFWWRSGVRLPLP